MPRKKTVKRQKTGGRRRPTQRSIRRIHEARTPHAQRIDEALKAKEAPSLEAWMKQPGRYDISGVDLPASVKAARKRHILSLGEEVEKLKLESIRKIGLSKNEIDRRVDKAIKEAIARKETSVSTPEGVGVMEFHEARIRLWMKARGEDPDRRIMYEVGPGYTIGTLNRSRQYRKISKFLKDRGYTSDEIIISSGPSDIGLIVHVPKKPRKSTP